MIVVATADFEVYHDAVAELRDRGVSFTTIEPDGELPEETRVVLTAPNDELDSDLRADGDAASRSGSDADHGAEAATSEDTGGLDAEVVVVDPGDPRGAVEEALAISREANGRTIIGVDPGEQPGIAVCTGGIVIAAFQVPLTEAATVIEREASGASDPLVRIGDGARLRGASIVDDLEGFTVELVDETGTTPSLGSGARGMGDVLAAANIARLSGERIETRDVEPTAGEIETIKHRSREASNGGRTIDEALARRVARGELSIEEALDEHRSE